MFERTERPTTARALGELRSAVEVLSSVPVADVPDATVEEGFAELQRASALLELERMRWLGEVDRRRLHARDGHLSVSTWLAARFAVALGAARSDAHLAAALPQMAVTRRAIADGEMSVDQARLLAAAHEEDPGSFAASERMLVAAASRHTVRDLATVTHFWRDRVIAGRGLDPDEVRFRARALHVSRTFAGMVRLDADLDPATGEPVLTAVGAVMDTWARSEPDDRRTPAQRRADALGEICRSWLDRSDRPQVAGERPHVTVTVDVGTLEDPSSGVATFDRTGSVGAGAARLLACDASIQRVVMAGRSMPLDVGRRTDVVPPAIRRALIVRDEGCRFPGCDRPQSWCDAHHVVHWADGGPTSLANLALLCRRHHHAVHERTGFSLVMDRGEPVFRRPDGSLLIERAPP
ncbi:MAG TPA: DUF222 domain-containing protein [Actinomycetota bacterium]